MTGARAFDSPLVPVERALAVTVDALPGLTDVAYALAKTKQLQGDADGARVTLDHCLSKDPTMPEAHLLLAQVHLQKNNIRAASQALEVGLSYNFQVFTSNPFTLLHLIIYAGARASHLPPDQGAPAAAPGQRRGRGAAAAQRRAARLVQRWALAIFLRQSIDECACRPFTADGGKDAADAGRPCPYLPGTHRCSAGARQDGRKKA